MGLYADRRTAVGESHMGMMSSPRYWDEEAYESRQAGPDDDPACVFQAFIPHPIADWDVEMDGECVERVMVAEDAIRRLGDECGDAAALPAEWLVRRAESAASSTIEGVHPSARRLARAEAQLGLFGEQPRPNDLEALRNVNAFDHALEIAAENRPLTVEDIASVHRMLMEDDPLAGNIRAKQNWIGPGRLWSTPLTASYIPPPFDTVYALMSDLIDRVNRGKGHPIVEMAVVHAQFEMIHPFGDGNGRTGRALIQMMLQRSRLSPPCTLPISSALALRKDDYIAALEQASVVAQPDDPARSLAIRPWIALAAGSVSEAVSYARHLIKQVAAIKQGWLSMVTAEGRPSKPGMRLIDQLPAHPVLNAEKAAELLGASWRTGARALEQLEQAGVLVQRSAGRRNRVYEAEAITAAFSAATDLSPVHFEQGLQARPEDGFGL
ncbi:Fic family protein [Candidatus Poriferisocius sp.]|uniref:Fic family protein n=1 Tax=Candidatus Poriferisocius sp. TaxID=3101276 RepID=UPI003B5A2961